MAKVRFLDSWKDRHETSWGTLRSEFHARNYQAPTNLAGVRLSLRTLDRLPASVARPKFSPAELTRGIIHLGCGSFHRAHQALLTQHVMNENGDLRWGIESVAISSKSVVGAMQAQDNIYTVLFADSESKSVEVVGSIGWTVHSPTDDIGVPHRIASPQTKIVTLTVTEGGYCISPVSGRLELNSPQVCYDLAHTNRPAGVIGMVARGLDLVRLRGGRPPVIMSCDNMVGNGTRLRQAVIDFAANSDDALAEWIGRNVQFPSSAVDRIVVPPSESDLTAVQQLLGGTEDRVPVVAEPFMNWIIEDIDGERPEWERAGVRFVSDANCYASGKLRLLNGTQILLAYVGALAGYRTIGEAIADPVLGAMAYQFMLTEQGPTLAMPPDELAHVARDLVKRFSNPALCHEITRVGRNASAKLALRITDPMRENMTAGRMTPFAALFLACWISGFITGSDASGCLSAVVESRRNELTSLAMANAHDPLRLAQAFVRRSGIFGELFVSESLERQIADTLDELWTDDTIAVAGRRLLPDLHWK